MNKLLTKIVGLTLGLSMAIGVGVAVAVKGNDAVPAHAANVSDTIDSTTCSSWQSATTSWHDDTYTGGSTGLTYNTHYMGGGSNADGRLFAWNANGYIYVSGTATRELVSVTITTAANTKSIGVYASNTAYSGSPTGSALATLSATTSGAKYTFASSYKYLALKGTASSTFIKSIIIEYGEESSTPELSLNKASINVSVGEDATFIVSATNLTANFSVNGGDSDYFSTNYTPSKANGNHTVTLHGNETTSSPITLTVSSTGAISQTIDVSVVPAVYYEKVTAVSALKDGSEVIIGTTDGTNLLGKYVSGNNCPSIENVPNASGKLIESNLPDGFALLTLSQSASAWTLTDQDSNIYYSDGGDTNILKANSTSTTTWSISVSAAGVATITCSVGSKTIKKNSTSALFNSYASGQTDVSIYMIPSSDKAIQVEVTGSLSLGVGETASLHATKLNGATGTVQWATSSSSALSLSAASGDSVTVTAGSILGSATITASLTDCADVVTSFTVRKGSSSVPYSVAEAMTAIDGGDAAAKTNVCVSGIISQVDSLNSDNSITYWISDDGTTTDQFEVYKGFDLDGDPFTAVTDLEVGDEVVVRGDIKKYSPSSGDPIYEFNAGNQLISFNRPSKVLATITAIEGSLSATAGDPAWDLSTLVVKGTMQGDATVVTVTMYVDLTTLDVPGTPATTTVRDVAVTATGKDDTTITYTNEHVSGTVTAFAGLVDNGNYRISATRDTVTYYLKENGTSSAPTAVTDYKEATVFTFTKVAANTYTIMHGESYLYCTKNNNGVRFGSTADTWTISNGTRDTGAYDLYSAGGERYLSLYAATDADPSDWRGYGSPTAANREENTDLQAFNADQYATEFTTYYAAGCNAEAGTYDPADMDWTTAETQFGYLAEAEQAKLVSAEYTKTGSGTSTVVTPAAGVSQAVAEAVARYDYLVVKYTTSVFKDFMVRSPSHLVNPNSALSMLGNTDNVVTIIAIISVISVSAIGGFFFLRKRKEQ